MAILMSFMTGTANKDIFCLDINGRDDFFTIITSFYNIGRLFCVFLGGFERTILEVFPFLKGKYGILEA